MGDYAMQKHPGLRICKVSDIDDAFLTFKLTKDQRNRVPKGQKVTFRRSTQKYEGYRQFLSRAEYDKVNPVTGRKKATAAGSKLLGIIWDDEPEWLYETDKTKSSIGTRRSAAISKKHASGRRISSLVSSLFAEMVEYETAAPIVRKIPVGLFLTAATVCSCRGLTDATSVANYWNANLPWLRSVFPDLDLQEISHDSVRRIYMSLSESSLRELMSRIYEWLPKWTEESGRRHYAVDGQACRSSRNTETDRKMMILNAVDVTAGKLCSSHIMISTKSHEPKYAPELLTDFNLHGATVTFDALNTTPEIASTIVNRGGYYLLAVKKNQPKLHESVVSAINDAVEANKALDDYGANVREHGRWEARACIVLPASVLPKEILSKWPGLEDGCMIKAKTRSFRKRGNGEWGDTEETRYFITCHPFCEKGIEEWLATCIRSHWGVESFHWTMDAIWRQDQMQCMYPEYLRARESLAKLGHNLLVTFRKIDQEERRLKTPRSETQLSHEIGVTLENGLDWLAKIFEWKAVQEQKSE